MSRSIFHLKAPAEIPGLKGGSAGFGEQNALLLIQVGKTMTFLFYVQLYGPCNTFIVEWVIEMLPGYAKHLITDKNIHLARFNGDILSRPLNLL